jgi:thiosulfate reductase cytochrome b subunit
VTVLIRRIVIFVLVLVLMMPLAIITTLLMAPFFSWIEARFGIEAVGHSGPAEWCYVTVYVTLVVFVTVGSQRLISRVRSPS